MTWALLTTNSPGELHSWVRGTVAELRRQRPELRIAVALVPCPYASGAEARVAAGIPGVDLVLKPLQTVLMSLGWRPAGLPWDQPGVVVFLGGEPWHAYLLARSLRRPAVAYAVRPFPLAGRFARVGTLDPGLADTLRDRGCAGVRAVGNLILDGVPEAAGAGEGPHGPTLGLFPGSRCLHLQASLAVFLRVAELVKGRVPQVRCLLAA